MNSTPDGNTTVKFMLEAQRALTDEMRLQATNTHQLALALTEFKGEFQSLRTELKDYSELRKDVDELKRKMYAACIFASLGGGIATAVIMKLVSS